MPGQTIQIREAMRKNVHVLDAMEGVAYNLSYLQVDKNAFAAHFTTLPERNEIPVPVDEQLIVEFYTRLT